MVILVILIISKANINLFDKIINLRICKMECHRNYFSSKSNIIVILNA
jgi:hypothetical protein